MGKSTINGQLWQHNPKCSMYDISTYMLVIFRANGGKYSIHGAYGNDCRSSLVGGMPTPLKKMKVGMMTFPIYGKIENVPVTTNHLLYFSTLSHVFHVWLTYIYIYIHLTYFGVTSFGQSLGFIFHTWSIWEWLCDMHRYATYNCFVLFDRYTIYLYQRTIMSPW